MNQTIIPSDINVEYSAKPHGLALDDSKHTDYDLEKHLKEPLLDVLSHKNVNGFTGKQIMDGNHTGSPTYANPAGAQVAWTAQETSEYVKRKNAVAAMILSLIPLTGVTLRGKANLYLNDPGIMLREIIRAKRRPLSEKEESDQVVDWNGYTLLNSGKGPKGWGIATCVVTFFGFMKDEGERRGYDDVRVIREILQNKRWPTAFHREVKVLAKAVRSRDDEVIFDPFLRPDECYEHPAGTFTTGAAGGRTAHPRVGEPDFDKISALLQAEAITLFQDGDWIPTPALRVMHPIAAVVDIADADPAAMLAGAIANLVGKGKGKSGKGKGKGKPGSPKPNAGRGQAAGRGSQAGGRSSGQNKFPYYDKQASTVTFSSTVPTPVSEKGTAIICKYCGGIGHMPYQCATYHINNVTVPKNTLLGIKYIHIRENPIGQYMGGANQVEEEVPPPINENAEVDELYANAAVQLEQEDEIPVVGAIEDIDEGDPEHDWDAEEWPN